MRQRKLTPARQLPLAAAIALVALGLGPLPAFAAGSPQQRTLKLTATAEGIGTYLYLPLDVPPGVNRIDGALDPGGSGASLGLGLFDERGAQYGSPGYRGIFGAEEHRFFVAADAASRSFLPGTIRPGHWTVVVPVFTVPTPHQITVTVTMTFGSQRPAAKPEPAPELVRRGPGWYRGDLHDHSTESSDAFSSGSALRPSEYAAAARLTGLDYVSLTDHNTASQNLHLGSDSRGEGVLLLGGEEMTNWFHGHSTVTGMRPGEFYDWRQRPRPLPLFENEQRIEAFTAATRRSDVYTSAAHPFGGQLSWQFFSDATLDPAALPDGLEVWNGAFQEDDEAAVRKWDEQLRAGMHTPANGGSDVHGVKAKPGITLGFAQPTTVTFARDLARGAIVDALRHGRSFITESPSGPELYLSGTAPGGQRETVGGSLYGSPADVAALSVVVRRGAGSNLIFLRGGVPVSSTPISSDDQTVTLDQPFGTGGYVRVELRRAPHVDQANPESSDTGMRALTNPIYLTLGAPPPGQAPLVAPPPPAGTLATAGRSPRALRLSAKPARVTTGRRVRVRFRVTARPAPLAGLPATPLPVSDALVDFAGMRRRSDARGYVLFRFTPASPAVLRAGASKRDFVPAATGVRVRPASPHRERHRRPAGPRLTG